MSGLGDGIKGKRSKTDFSGSSTRRAKRTSDGGAVATPKPPPILVLYEPVLDTPPADQPLAIYGQYHPDFIPKMLPWLGCRRDQVLHVCSGALPKGEGIRVDIRPSARPDILADGRNLPFADGTIAGVMLDPPYSEEYALALYGVPYPLPGHLLAEAIRVVRPGGCVIFVHYFSPPPPAGSRFVKAFGLSTGFNFPIRAATVYQKDQPFLPGVL